MEHMNFDSADTEGKPPFLGSWKSLYVVVLLNLFALVILFYFFSKAFQ